jgi:hypothetical protein
MGASPSTGGAPTGGTGGSAGTLSTGGTTSGGSADGGATDGGATTGGVATGGTTSGGTTDGGTTTGGTTGGVATGGAATGGATGGASEIALTVTTNADIHPISPLIYGVNLAHGITCSNAKARFTLCRLGGNPWSTYNWENNASNAGADSNLCSENTNALGASDVPAATVTSLVTEAGAKAAAAVVTIPMLDYVAADKVSGDPYPLCSGDVRESTDYQTTRLRHNQARKGTDPVDPPDTTDANVSQDEFLSYLKSRSGTTKVLITLDNQPELWGQTHIALHPAHTTYSEVVARSTEYAKMIRATWPGAEITGYGGYGYYAFLNLQDAPDSNNRVFLDYFLGAMKAASTTANERLIDYLDIHWYPEFPDTAQERVQAPRSLWDPDYKEKSWIADSVGPIKLVPWLLEKIATYYPGTKLAISSYAYGGVDDASGGVAVADALGAFGREGVSLAGLQPQDGNNTFSLAAMAAYRNYDGAGASFGDQSVRATTSDIARVSVYGSIDSQVAGRVVIVAINRSPDSSVVNLDVVHSSVFTSADVYLVSAAAAGPVPSTALTSTGSNRFHTALPGYSVSVIVPKP